MKLDKDKTEDLRYSLKLTLYKETKFFGPGVVTLLEHVDQTHSLSKASKRMSLAYTKALKIIKTAEQSLGYPLLDRQTGGASGGGSILTPNAHILMQEYKTFEYSVNKAANQQFDILVSKMNKLK